MTHAWESGETAPSPEELMAFADNELPSARRSEVSGWLASHPESAAEVDEQRRLHRLWQHNAPPEPSPQAWEKALLRIDTAVPLTAPPRPRPWHRPVWLAAAVAAVLPLVFLGRFLLGPGPDLEEPFPVAEAHEVDIVSMDAHEADSLVGHPSLLGNLQFTTADDVHDVQVNQPEDGWGADVKDGDLLMLVASPAKAPGR